MPEAGLAGAGRASCAGNKAASLRMLSCMSCGLHLPSWRQWPKTLQALHGYMDRPSIDRPPADTAEEDKRQNN